MTERHFRPEPKHADSAAGKPLEPIDTTPSLTINTTPDATVDSTIEALVQQRTAALQQENDRLRAELKAQQQIEATLRQREEQFNALINNVPGAVYRAAFDADWTIAFISDAIATLTGYPAADFIHNTAQSFNKICHPDDLERVNRVIRTAIEAKQSFVVEYRNIRADGQVVWVCEQGHGVYDEDGKGLCLDGVVLDITELKQTEAALRRSEERLKLITNALPVCISYVDREKRLQIANQTYETWFGRPLADMQGKRLSEVLGNAAYQLIQDKVERALAGELMTYELELPYQWGGTRYVSSVLVPDMDAQQQVHGYYALVMDVSEQQAILRERKQAEDAVKQQADRDRLLSTIAQRIRQSLHLDDILNTTVKEVRALLHADRVVIYRFQPDRQGVVMVESVGQPWRSLLGTVIVDPRLSLDAFKQSYIEKCPAIDDIHSAGLSDHYLDLLVQSQIKALLRLPIIVSETIWGLLIVQQCAAPRAWQPWEVDFLAQLATQLAIAIHQSELFQQVQQLNTVLEGQIQDHINQLQQALAYEALLKRITDSVRDSLDENQIFQTAVRELAIGLKLNSCSSGLYDLDQQMLTIAYEHICDDLPPGIGHQIPLAVEPDVYGQVIQGQCFQFCPLPDFSNPVRAIHTKYTILACPISVAVESVAIATKQASLHPEIIGDLWLFRPKEMSFSEMEIRLVQQVTNQCAIALRQARLYQAAQAQVFELERLNHLKDDFLSTVSHELRTPMSSIKMATQMLEVMLFHDENSGIGDEQEAFALDLHPSNVEKISRYFQILKDEGEREIKLINDLLDLSRLDSGRDPLFLATMHLQIWLPHVAESFVERTESQQQSLPIVVSPDVPPMTTDFSYLERVVTELLQNACKYTPSGGTITLLANTVATPADALESSKHISMARDSMAREQFAVDRLHHDRPYHDRVSTIALTITNSGVEIPAAERDRVFDKFYRIPHHDPWKHGGTGLGLALVKKLVERLGGKIWVESSHGQTSFVVHLPSQLS